MKYELNEGILDRTIRIFLGLAILFSGIFLAKGVWIPTLIIIGFLVLFTGFLGFCLIYTILKINTRKKITKN